MIKVSLGTMADEVHDEPSFLAFLEALAIDWEDERRKEKERPSSSYSPGVNGWENPALGDFLYAAQRPPLPLSERFFKILEPHRVVD